MPSLKFLIAAATITSLLAIQAAPAQAAAPHRTATATSHHSGHALSKRHKHKHKHHHKHHKAH